MIVFKITDEEFERQVQKLKKGKASGKDQLKPEAILYAGEDTKETIRRLMETCMNGGAIPDDWRDTIIHPLYKKGSPELAENYRGISLVNCGYKLYAGVLKERLSTFVEENGILPDMQNVFREGRSTMDSIYIFNTCIQTAIAKGLHL